MYPAPYTSGEAFEYTKTTTILPPVTATNVNLVPTYTSPPVAYPAYPAYPGYPPPPPGYNAGMMIDQQMMAARMQQQQAFVTGATSALALCCCL